ncbi:MAG: SCO family protein [Acidobacteria bacterium]|nr:MAG: SCO family protein [Acidobacteriota bacterium]
MKASALAVALVSAAVLASAQPAQERPTLLRDVGYDQRLGEQVPLDLVFRDEVGRLIPLRSLFRGRAMVLSLVYYQCPMLCTLTLNGLASALSVLTFDVGKEFDVVTVSFEPKETAPLAAAKKKAHLERYPRPGAAEGWHFLTGDAPAIAALTRAVGFRYVWDAETRQYAHPAGLVVLTPDGRIARYMYGVEYAPRDLRLALVEASQRRIGNPVDTVLLYCYQYDPARGRYAASVLRLVRLGGILTVLGLASFVLVSLRRERAG